MSEPGDFELEPEPRPEAPKPAPPPRRPSSPPDEKKPVTSAQPSDLPGRIGPRTKKRLLRVVPGMAVAYLIVGWLFVGEGVWAFPLVGAAVGVFAAFERPAETVLGSVAAGAGFATTIAVRGFPLGFGAVIVIATCAVMGALAAIDDRLSGP